MLFSTPLQPTWKLLINGSVQNYSGGASTIKLLANGDYTLAESSTNPALGSAPLSAAGVFSLALPPLAVITPYLSETGSGPAPSANCSSSVTVSDPTSQGYRFADLQYLISVSPKPSELLFCRARQQNPMLIKLLSLVSLET